MAQGCEHYPKDRYAKGDEKGGVTEGIKDRPISGSDAPKPKRAEG